MMLKVEVLQVGYSTHGRCVIITYQNGDHTSYAAVARQLSLKVGDTVWVLRDDELNYRGFGAVAVLLA